MMEDKFQVTPASESVSLGPVTVTVTVMSESVGAGKNAIGRESKISFGINI